MSDDPIARWNALVESIQRPMQDRIAELEAENAALLRQWNELDLRNEQKHREWSEKQAALEATIQRTWTALGLQTFDEAKGRTVDEFARVRIGELEAEIKRLETLREMEGAAIVAAVNSAAEVDRDAERYRFLRDPKTPTAEACMKRTTDELWEFMCGEELDAAIDAVRKEHPNG